ncbi:MAG: hypothetical protein GY807_03585 [Gammaproteobacteria bacterium]|nr:hypothetical protein [Gammaproteobacteria bacterium]
MSNRVYVAMLSVLLGFGVCTLLAKCKMYTPDPRLPPPPVEIVYSDRAGREDGSFSMLSYYRWLLQHSGKAMQGEYEHVEGTYAAHETLRNRLMLALLLSLQDRPFRDDRRAKILVKGILSNDETVAEDDRALASFIDNLLKERERYEDEADKLRRRVQDFNVVVNELHEERALREKLENQLEQLKDIEENLIERERSERLPLSE